jgi:hypothetical protein
LRVNPYQALFGDPLRFVDPMGADGESAATVKTDLDEHLDSWTESDGYVAPAVGWLLCS